VHLKEVSILGAIFGKKGWAGQGAGVSRIAIFEIRLFLFGGLIVLCAFGVWSWMKKSDRQSYVSVPLKISKVEVGEKK